MQEFLKLLQENIFEIVSGAGVVLAVIFGKGKTSEQLKKQRAKQLEKLKNKGQKQLEKAQATAEKVKEMEENASSL